ncbi:MAG: prolipoprotein diacylglyceryl transferase [Chloroflexi bacterium]|nr:prolipoprotein diacylglyceryl transferase [Chloroflexota bacterium]
MIDWTPVPIALQLGPIPLYWYGVAYAVGLLGVYLVATRMAARYGQNPDYVGNGMIVIGVAALIGGRLYHVIDQFQLYQDDLLKIVLPPYTGLGVYGGMVTGMVAFVYLARRWRLDLWTWFDIGAPAIFVMQALGRWGNFFNQELYGPPTSLPWGIAIDCAHRVAAYPCETFPLATTHFTPLFLYESVSGFAGAAFLMWLASKPRPRLRRGDLLPIMFIWYSIVRFLLEFLRTGNWRLDGIPTAQLFSIGFIVVSLGVLAYRHLTAPPSDIVGVPPDAAHSAEGPASPDAGPAGAAPPAPDPEPLT